MATRNELDPLLAQLRRAVWPWHQRLDRHPLLAPLVAPAMTATQYARALAALAAPWSVLEAELMPECAAIGLAARSKALTADLATLGVVPLPLAAALPPLPSAGARWGALYVLAGANRGGTLIAQRLAQRLPSAPRAFFAGADEGAWQRFAAALKAAALPPSQAQAALAGAPAVFAFLLQHLDAHVCLSATHLA